MMRMDEIMEEFSGSSDQIVVKRKRTKRPRPSSSASSSGGGYAEFYINSLQVSSPATTSSTGISTSTEEDEDMANCLILLARGMSSPPQPEEEIKAVTGENKFSSLKFTEMPTSTNGGRVGIYVYECKTCNRTFPSFQALGGHRASHKKPKTATDNDQKKSPPHTAAPLVDQQEEERKLTKINTAISPPPSTQSQNKSCNNDPNKPKIHECSICGAEFASGQALGGHMRRHRPAPKIGASTDSDTTMTSHEAGDKKPKNVFSLDLNLPAPQEDEKFSHQQQPHLVFSAAALVDCHY